MALNTEDPEIAEAITRGIGDEMRHRREKLGLSRAQFVERLPSRLGDRTMLAYEHGVRKLTVVRLVELSEGLGVGAPIILGMGLQRAQVTIESIPLRVDLNQLLESNHERVAPLHRWAMNRMEDSKNGVVEVLPPGIRELAASVGFPNSVVAQHLVKFLPKN